MEGSEEGFQVAVKRRRFWDCVHQCPNIDQCLAKDEHLLGSCVDTVQETRITVVNFEPVTVQSADHDIMQIGICEISEILNPTEIHVSNDHHDTAKSAACCVSLCCSICLENITQEQNIFCPSGSPKFKIIATIFRAGPSSSGRAERPDSAALAPCGHRFHAVCIIEAMKHDFACLRRPLCPLCRASLDQTISSRIMSGAGTARPGPEWGQLVRAARRGARRGARAAWRARCWRFRLAACSVAIYIGVFVALMVRYARQ